LATVTSRSAPPHTPFYGWPGHRPATRLLPQAVFSPDDDAWYSIK